MSPLSVTSRRFGVHHSFVVLVLFSAMSCATFILFVVQVRDENIRIFQQHFQSKSEILSLLFEASDRYGVRLILIDLDMLNFTQLGVNLTHSSFLRHSIVFAITEDQIVNFTLSLLILPTVSPWSVSTSPLICSADVNPFVASSQPCSQHSGQPAHIVLKQNGMVVHVMVLFARGSFYWTAPVSESLRTSLNDTPYGLKSRAFDRFQLQNVAAFGNVVFLPADVKGFLFDVGQSEFLECHPTAMTYATMHYSATMRKENIERQQKWVNDMLFVKNAFESNEMHLWLAAGTLLGWRRECGFILHTTDVDMATPFADFNEKFKLDVITGKLTSSERCIYEMKEIKNGGLELNLILSAVNIDVFYMYVQDDKMWCGYYVHPDVFIALYPVVERYCSCELYGHRFTVPCNVDAIVQSDYGDEWHKSHDNYSEWANIYDSIYSSNYRCFDDLFASRRRKRKRKN